MPDHDLHTFMAQVTAEMASEYDRIYARAKDDPGTAGDEGEENWARLFREWLPPSYHVETKGRLIGHDGRMSPQIDVVVLKPAYPKKLLEKKVWLADGVVAAFECKNTITAAYVKSSVKRCAEFKDLFPQRQGSPREELRSPLIYGLLAHSHSWKGDNSDPIGNIERALEAASPSVTHPRFEMDLLCVADLATWSSTYISRYEAAWQPDNLPALLSAFGASCGPITAMTCSSQGLPSQPQTFRPVGALLDAITYRLAWVDPNVRDISNYFRRVNLGGSSSGKMRYWPLSSYSLGVSEQIKAGRGSNGIWWDDWSYGF